MKTLILILLFMTNILNNLKILESNNNPNAIGDNGKAYGVLQIHKIAVDDVNRIYGTNYTHEDMFNVSDSEEVFCLYINHGIKLYEEKYGVYPSDEDIVRMWNGGIYFGYRKSSTDKYYEKYQKLFVDID